MASPNLQPIRLIPGEIAKPPAPGMALCLSGGGYRAMVFHLGALLRLNEAGLLKKLNRISSVSGGSITAGMLGLRWNALAFNSHSRCARVSAGQLVTVAHKRGGMNY
jgi:NTE family protein